MSIHEFGLLAIINATQMKDYRRVGVSEAGWNMVEWIPEGKIQRRG